MRRRRKAVGTALALTGALAVGAVLAIALREPARPPRPAGTPEVRVTVPEGLRKEEVARVLAEAGLSTREDLLAQMGDSEGYLFPDTYRFYADATAGEIVQRMRARLDELVDEPMRARMKELGWDLHTTLTLASIIEKETAVPDERARISAVFHNRLAKKMKLQTDPTVLYGMALGARDLKRADLERAHPYNTYVIEGLPPGPIAQPGLASIKAALWPMATDDLFFVAKGNTGAHEFCPTLACHNAAVEKWQIEFARARKRARR